MNRELIKNIEDLKIESLWDNFKAIVHAPTCAHLLDCGFKEGIDQYKLLRDRLDSQIKEIDLDYEKVAAFNLIIAKRVYVEQLYLCSCVDEYNNWHVANPKYFLEETEFNFLVGVIKKCAQY